jgi:hypothetical protein
MPPWLRLVALAGALGVLVGLLGARLLFQTRVEAQAQYQRLRAVARPFAEADAFLSREQARLNGGAARLRFYSQNDPAGTYIEQFHARSADRRLLARWAVVAVARAAAAEPMGLTGQGREDVARAINDELDALGPREGDRLGGFLVGQILLDTRGGQALGAWQQSAGTALTPLPPDLAAELRHLIADHGVQEHCTDGR